MPVKIHTTLELSHKWRNLGPVLGGYFERDSHDLDFSKILPPPTGIDGIERGIWKAANWGGALGTSDGHLRDDRYFCTVARAVPIPIFETLAALTGERLIVTTACDEHVEWTKCEYWSDRSLHPTYWASLSGNMTGDVPPDIAKRVEFYRCFV